jgi:protein-disulfide isomerase
MKAIWTIIVCLLLLDVSCIYGQDIPDNRKLDAILDELRQIHKLLESRPNIPITSPVRTTRIEVGKTPLLGSNKAPFTLVEFTDYQCKYCQQFYEQTFKDLKRLFIDTGKLRFYSMDLPLVEIHPAALLAAQAGRCGAEQNKFWAIYDKMKSNSKDLESTTLIAYAQEIGLDAAAFKECLESKRYKKEVEENTAIVKAKGVRGTPSFVLGKSTEFGVEGELISGVMPLNFFEQKLKGIGMDK